MKNAAQPAIRIPVIYSFFFLLTLTFSAFTQKRTVVIFLIDGLESITAKTASENGAANLKFIFDNGVVAEEAYCPTPTPRVTLEDKSEPWQGTSGPNISIHTGCHMLESRNMDDIFIAAREKGIKSVFAGGAKSYGPITTPDFKYADDLSDAYIVQKGIDHLKKDGTRLIRLHLQRIRDAWKGPSDRTNPNSAYIKAVKNADAELGRLIAALKETGVWDSTYLIVTSDHGMGNSSKSDHPATVLSSWSFFMGFYGPGLKRGETIPYAENTDIAILTSYLLGLRPLKGHTDPKVSIEPKGPTGTLLTNIFTGAPHVLNHPKPIKSYLESVNMKPGSNYTSYRNGIKPFLKLTTAIRDVSRPDNTKSLKRVWFDSRYLHYYVENPSQVKINIFNLYGKLVETLVNRHHDYGKFSIDFISPTTLNRPKISSGKYLVQIMIDNKTSLVELFPFQPN